MAKWVKKASKLKARLDSTLLSANEKSEILELDEMWTFVKSKKNKYWLWMAICRRTRQIVAYYLGDRSEKSCKKLWKRIPEKYKKSTTYSDFWDAYAKVIQTGKHHSVGKESGQTSHIERLNLTFRQRMSRLVRKTLPYSKKYIYHNASIKNFIYYYNNWKKQEYLKGLNRLSTVI